MSNQIQLQQRIRHIAEELEKGVSNAEIVMSCSSLWNISERTAKTYISLAKDLVMGKLKQMDAVIEAVLTPSHVLKAIDIIWKRRGIYKQNIPEEKTKEFSLPNIVVNSEKDKQLIEQIFKLP